MCILSEHAAYPNVGSLPLSLELSVELSSKIFLTMVVMHGEAAMKVHLGAVPKSSSVWREGFPKTDRQFPAPL